MAIAQKLYEAGKITCMRSDAVMVAPEAQVAARSWLTAAFGEGAVPAEPPRYESKEGLQEAHEAIRPTDPAAGGLVAQEGEAVGRAKKAASEKAAADQRLQSRCGSCGGAQQRWKMAGGYVQLCAGVARVRGRGVRGRAASGGPARRRPGRVGGSARLNPAGRLSPSGTADGVRKCTVFLEKL